MASRRFRFRRLTNSPPRMVLSISSAWIVGGRARRADVADAQLRLRGAGPRHYAEPTAGIGGGGATRRRDQSARRRGGAPLVEHRGGEVEQFFFGPIADHHQRRAVRREHRGVQRARTSSSVIAVSAASVPERQVPVRMRAVQHARERALGERRRVILHLLQPLEPQVADAIEVVVARFGAVDDLVHDRQPGLEESIERRQRRPPRRPCRLRDRGRRRCARRDRRSRARIDRGCLRQAGRR